ncbi:unnamed protein product [Clonostachys rhizophaga]|uniref:glutamate decarboxylase n=1 Tax=Clonostachys rhizophaga TaxID=160324 RepID=A0A9N9YL21_9HYPO|nr:unnamed protein product [Clonostachys rhizophaga]
MYSLPLFKCHSTDLVSVGVVMTLGNTYTGHFDPVDDDSRVLGRIKERTGHRIPIHVDAASRGFIAPFLNRPDFRWDFSNQYVDSINASGHKFGMTPPTIGWIIWRDDQCLPDGMVYRSSYLRGDNSSCTLTFSQSSYALVVQYYNLMRLGRQGFERSTNYCIDQCRQLATLLESTGWFKNLGGTETLKHTGTADKSSRLTALALPVIALSIESDIKQNHSLITEEKLSEELFRKGYSVPCATLLGGKDNKKILRIVIRPEMTEALLSSLYNTLYDIVHELLSK